MKNDLKDFLDQSSYFYKHVRIAIQDMPLGLISDAFDMTCLDAKYHFPEVSNAEIGKRIIFNGNELPVFLYRIGRLAYLKGLSQDSLNAIHFLMRHLCACEFYYSSDIGEGFYAVHGGLGSVISSRHKIGSGLLIHQGCTIGHAKPFGAGCNIGNNLRMMINSSIFGELIIGDNVTLGAYSMVNENIPSNMQCIGIPAKIAPKVLNK